jgi:DNA repair exonuclease SbcCD nuclease subunit
MKYVVSGDQHLRYDKPVCRTETEEEWLVFQEREFQKIIDFTNENKAILCLTGDLFDIPRVPAEIVNMAVRVLNRLDTPAYMISGNHEKLYHREANVDISSIGVFKNHPKVHYLEASENVYGTRFEHSAVIPDTDITLVHTLCFRTEDDKPFGVEALTARELADRYPTQYIFVGDMHEPWVYTSHKQCVISSGKMTSQTVKEGEQCPQVYLIDTERGTCASYELDNPDVSREHLDIREQRDSRIQQALELIKKGVHISLSFKDNLHKKMESSGISPEAINIIDEIEEENND